MVVPEINTVDLVNDVLRKRKSFEPVGWKTFTRVLKDVNTPMDLMATSIVGCSCRHTQSAMTTRQRKRAVPLAAVVVVVSVDIPRRRAQLLGTLLIVLHDVTSLLRHGSSRR